MKKKVTRRVMVVLHTIIQRQDESDDRLLSKDNYTIEFWLRRGGFTKSFKRKKVGVALGQPHYHLLSQSSHAFSF